MMREPAPIATWRDLYALAITRVRGASALMDACAIVIAASGNDALQEAVAARLPGVHTSCWLLDEHHVPVPNDVVRYIVGL